MVDGYLEDYSPGEGRRSPARSWLDSDAPQLSLNGEWRFRWSPVAYELGEEFADPGFDDAAWDVLPVPSHWVLPADSGKTGSGAYGRPIYTNVQYPFPIDPPHVPDENPTGDHRRSFELPDWDVERVLLRFDGVESVYRVWLNGVEVGVGKGSRLVQEFDVTGIVRPGHNVIAVRVHQWSSMSYLEDQDQWWLPGIFRDVTLLGRPRGALDDVWLRTAYAADGIGTITPEIVAADQAYPVVVEIPELGVRQRFERAEEVAPFAVGPVEPWSAESPRRYAATVRSSGETVSLALGFRTVRIEGDRFLVNDRRVVFRGMNRHETHPVRGRVFDADHARSDLIAMKRAGVNAIRTSHYPPHPRVLELADELGFWVIDECDLETHGFFFADRVGNPSDDPRWADAYLDRIERTVERDKNHPCVVIWSLGNESGTGANLAAMSAFVHRRDPGRPVHYEGDYGASYTDLYSRMYPNLTETEAIGGETGPIRLLTNPADARRVRSKPFMLCEYAHAMGNGPGGLSEYDALAETYPRLHGGFIWEWRDHGLRARTADGTPYYAYGGDFGEAVHDGNFVMDGMILPDDTPMPSLAEFAAVNAPVLFSLEGPELTVVNRYHSLDTSGLRFVAVLEVEGREVARADLSVPVVAAGDRAVIALPDSVTTAGDGESWLTVRAELAADLPWAEAGHAVGRAQFPVGSTEALNPGPFARTTDQTASETPESGPFPRRTDQTASQASVGGAEFDDHGGLVSLFGLPVRGPWLELWRAPTDNDRSDSRGSYELGALTDDDGEGAPGPSSAQRWRERGLDRLTHRVRAITRDGDELAVSVRVGAANSTHWVDVTYRWRSTAGGVRLGVEVSPSADWDCTWPRVGVRFDLPANLARAEWFGTGPAESYPDSKRAAYVGRFAAGIDDLNVVYSRPQETGHRAELRELTVLDDHGPRLKVITEADRSRHRPGFTLTRHTPQQIDRAAHPYELPVSETIHLFIDDAVHGLGSRACGFDVLPQHALWPGGRQFAMTFVPPAGPDGARPARPEGAQPAS